MRQTFGIFRLVFLFSSVIAFAAQVTARAESVEPLTAQHDTQAWLKKIQSSAQKLNYSGTFVYQQGNQVRTSRITHILNGKNEVEKLEILDGKPREYIRNNEEIVCYVPESKSIRIEKRVTKDVFPAILGAHPNELAEHYKLKMGETGRVAGFDCQAIILEPKDKLRYGYKLWAEKSTGLLLKAQTINEKNDVVEQIAFTQLVIGHIDASRVKPSVKNTQGWRVENAVMSETNLSGWSVNAMPAGFKKVREMKRLITDTPASAAAENASPTQREVSQIVYSDGLAAISVFIEPASQSRTEGSMQQGAMNIVGKRHGEYWLTVVGEVPASAIKQVANSIELKAQP
ncbi:MucB/RseB C-terminal domain-containing protein [Herminiimonas fonticola]|uniref:MucB/RseB-like sigma(E) regulatory protein n=1 Tax=Herminiimonas fonticola TaxID=303380 RepID=A0A4R6GIH7_9BURK|nr:MucB/RseB C-terminal domain-containing protein [Herminiimonas fonticola]RBA25713.1 Negative regulator of sigma E activity [Herminiimonas fonticola]TDN94821.1 MucB/RseB-like sigma(E) regulatory protein [Herminiimonas fonticola]